MSESDQQPSRGRGRMIGAAAAALVVGAALGFAIGYLGFDTQADAGSTRTDAASADPGVLAASHVEYGCDIAERLAQSHPGSDDFGSLQDDPAFQEIPAMMSLLQAAAILDSQYADLGEAGRQTQRDYTRLNLDEIVSHAAGACGDR